MFNLRRWLALLACICALTSLATRADVLIVADEFPAMQVLAQQLKSAEHRESKIVDQAHLPQRLDAFEAVVAYIHEGLDAAAEHAFIQYAQQGGRLVLLHHSISSGKRQNRDWFNFLGVELPEGPVDAGGYKWIEGVTMKLVNLATNHFIMTNQVVYPEKFDRQTPSGAMQSRPAFTLHETEVYLNHRLQGPRTVLMALDFKHAASGKEWFQQTAGWVRPAEKGWVVYLMAGHSQRDFENPVYGHIVLNAIVASPAQLGAH
jgi:hypothetical protein